MCFIVEKCAVSNNNSISTKKPKITQKTNLFWRLFLVMELMLQTSDVCQPCCLTISHKKAFYSRKYTVRFNIILLSLGTSLLLAVTYR